MSDAESKEANKRDRSPKFPYIGLSKSIERIETLHNKVKRYEARIVDIAKDWGLSATSSSTDRTVAALQSFGLVEDSGAGENRKIKLSELGARILVDARPGVRDTLLAEAAIKPAIIAEYARRWQGGRPDDSHALSQLQFEGNFTADGAKIFLRVFDETIRFVPNKGFDSPVDPETVEERTESEPETDNSAHGRGKNQIVRSERQEVKAGTKEDVFSLQEGDVTLRWPEAISAESYQDLEDWTKLLLRKIKRSVTNPATSGTDN